jgi:hypothetical protein
LLTTSGKYLEVSGDDIQARTLCGRFKVFWSLDSQVTMDFNTE